MSELKFSINQRFSGIADLWVVKALVWTTNHTGSPIPKIDTVPYRRGYPRLSFSLRKCAFWSYLYPFFNRKPEFSRPSGVCGLKVQLTAVSPTRSRKSAHCNDRPVKYPTHYSYMLTLHMFELQETVTPTLKPTKLLAPESPCTAMTGLPNTTPLTRTC